MHEAQEGNLYAYSFILCFNGHATQVMASIGVHS